MCIIGAAGYIGSFVVCALVARGHKLSGLTRAAETGQSLRPEVSSLSWEATPVWPRGR